MSKVLRRQFTTVISLAGILSLCSRSILSESRNSTHQLNTFQIPFAPVCLAQTGAFSVYAGLRKKSEPFIKFFLTFGCRFCIFGIHKMKGREAPPHTRAVRREVRKMKDSCEQRIQKQFGSFCTTVLKNEALYIEREESRLKDREKSIDDLDTREIELISVSDKYFMDEHIFEVLGLPIVVTGDLLAEALARLPEEKRDVILLSYYLGMTDREIAKRMNVVRQTISKRRLVTLKELRKYLMKEGFEW